MGIEAKRERAIKRRATATLLRTTLSAHRKESGQIKGAQALTLVTRLTRYCWSISGKEWPKYSRADMPVSFDSIK